jgi:hypothetical protein
MEVGQGFVPASFSVHGMIVRFCDLWKMQGGRLLLLTGWHPLHGV